MLREDWRRDTEHADRAAGEHHPEALHKKSPV
jgi:hypothetical protein